MCCLLQCISFQQVLTQKYQSLVYSLIRLTVRVSTIFSHIWGIIVHPWEGFSQAFPGVLTQPSMCIHLTTASKTCRCILASGKAESATGQTVNTNQHPAKSLLSTRATKCIHPWAYKISGSGRKTFKFCPPPPHPPLHLPSPHLTLLCSSHTYLWETEDYWTAPSLFKAHHWCICPAAQTGSVLYTDSCT